MVSNEMTKTKLYLNYAGHCLAKEHHAIRGGRKETIKYMALWGLIEHPEKGYILYDTGYSDRFFDATKRYPNKIYAKATKVVFSTHEAVSTQLQRANIDPASIKHVLITHFHADHTAGMKDFPNAQFYVSKAALSQALSIPKAVAFSKGILKGLLPENLESRCVFIDDAPKVEDPILGTKHDLFGDKSLYAVLLPGHARGQFGIQLSTEKSDYFLIADACWLKKSYRENILPNSIVRLFFDSWKEFKMSLNKVHAYHLQHPEVVIVPTHCSETTDVLVSPNLEWDAL